MIGARSRRSGVFFDRGVANEGRVAATVCAGRRLEIDVAAFVKIIRSVLLLIAAVALSGCYLMQAARGQMEVSARRQPITTLLADPTTPDRLRDRLQYVAEAREFASRELGLPDNDSYRNYADLQRPFVVWNVFATPEFSVQPRRWCFPIAGCVVYRGYFKEAAARKYALKLRMGGDDATVGGVAAYSTLGHFNDPVLNTMLSWNDAQLAATLFHELAHQVVYVPGDSEFNEAFATVVEEAGLERWLAYKQRSHELQAWRVQRQRSQQFIALLLQTRDRLAALYASGLPAREMRWRKHEEFGRMKFEYSQLKAQWNGYAGYDAWFDRALGNAHLVSAATYHGCVPGLQRMLASVGGDLARFYETVRDLAGAPKAVRRERLCDALMMQPVSAVGER